MKDIIIFQLLFNFQFKSSLILVLFIFFLYLLFLIVLFQKTLIILIKFIPYMFNILFQMLYLSLIICLVHDNLYHIQLFIVQILLWKSDDLLNLLCISIFYMDYYQLKKAFLKVQMDHQYYLIVNSIFIFVIYSFLFLLFKPILL